MSALTRFLVASLMMVSATFAFGQTVNLKKLNPKLKLAYYEATSHGRDLSQINFDVIVQVSSALDDQQLQDLFSRYDLTILSNLSSELGLVTVSGNLQAIVNLTSEDTVYLISGDMRLAPNPSFSVSN